MKTKVLRGWKSVFAVCSTILLLGCFDRTSRTTAQTVPEPSGASTVVTTNETAADALPAHAIIPPANLSPGLAEVIKLAQSGVSEQVLLAYVEKSNLPFNPNVDEIVYMKDIGISDAVVAAMVRHAENTNTVAEVSSNALTAPQEAPIAQAETNMGPSLIDPNAPSYSVSAETNYATAPLVPSQPQEVNNNYFESALSPYGSWIDVPDYGRCWQPTVVILNRNWRPYADRGRWVYTSSGWYWQSDYSWGWAPFHYGRWYCDNRAGWVWVPGQTWGPAWVSWRYTDQYCGWAPLPPSARYHTGVGFYYHNSHVGISFDFGLRDDCYTFIPTSRFCDRTPSHFYVSGSHAKTIYRNSVVINNYIRSNNTIINEGVGRERIASATHAPIRTVSLRELPANTKPVGRAERLEGNSLTVFRPDVTVPVNRSVTQRSLAEKAPLTQHSGTLNRSVRGSGQVENPVSKPAAPVQPKQPVVSRSLPSRSIVQGSPKSSDDRSSVPSRTTATAQPTRPDANASENTRVLHGRPTLTERSIRWDSVSTAVNRQSQSAPVAPSQIARETPVARPQTVTPSVVPQQRVQQPTAREIRREAPAQNNYRSEQRAAIVARPSPVAPAPIQQVSPAPVQRMAPAREASRPNPVERSVPAPTRTLTPSIHQFTPRETPAAPAQRSMERSVRSERGRS